MTRRRVSIMVKLKNIKKSNSLIECDILPEDSIENGHIVVDLKTEEIKDYFLPQNYEWCRNHVNHASRKLLELNKTNPLPKECTVMWY